MSEDNQGTNEIPRKLKSIEKRLKKLERGSISDLEHQLFFGIAFSILILFVTLEPAQISGFFQSVGFSPESAAETAIRIRNWGAFFTFLSTITRYYAALVKDEIRKSKKWRFISILLIVMSFELFLFFVVMNVTMQLPMQIGWMSLPLKIIVLFAIYRFDMYFLKERILSFYASKKLILKKHVEPVASTIFFLVSSGAYFSLVIYALVFLVQGFFSTEIFVTIFILCCVVLLIPFWLRSRKRLV